MAPQLTLTKGPFLHAESWWMNLANTSLPVPLSPWIKMGTLVVATLTAFCCNLRICSDRPKMTDSGGQVSKSEGGAVAGRGEAALLAIDNVLRKDFSRPTCGWLQIGRHRFASLACEALPDTDWLLEDIVFIFNELFESADRHNIDEESTFPKGLWNPSAQKIFSHAGRNLSSGSGQMVQMVLVAGCAPLGAYYYRERLPIEVPGGKLALSGRRQR